MKPKDGKAPAFQFYVKEYMTDEAVVMMTLEQQGAYIRLLCHQWLEGSIPASTSLQAKICGISPRKMRTVWNGIAPKFSPNGSFDRLINQRLEDSRSRDQEWRKKQSDGGRLGAEKRWNGDRSPMPDPIGDPMPHPMGSDSSASSPASAVLTKDSDKNSVSNETGASPPNGSQPLSETWTNGELMSLVRKRFYIPDGRPPTNYNDAREFTIFAALRKSGLTGVQIAAAIEGMAAIRDDGGRVDESTKVDWLESGDKLTMRSLYNTKSGILPVWTLAVQKYNQQNKRAPPAGMAGVGDVLRRAIGK